MKINNPSSKKPLYIILSIVLAVLIGAVIYYVVASQQNNNAEKYGSNETNPDKNVPVAKENKGGSGGISSPKTDENASSIDAPSSDVTPADPMGTFVSNHHPNLSGKPAPNTVSSTCSTTPGVNCLIRFTNGNITKELPTQRTDVNGNTAWTWTLQDIGITQGEWKITAVAINGNKTATSSDPMALSVE
jgi:hypothetical protein